MRLLLVLLLLLHPPLARAVPECVPAVYGTQVGDLFGQRTATGRHMNWYCRTASGGIKPEGFACVHGSCLAVGSFFGILDELKQRADPAAAVKQAWAEGFQDCATAAAGTPLRVVCDEMYESMRVNYPVEAPPAPPPPVPPAPTHVVKANTACKVEPCSRPAYELKAGVLGTKEVARAPIGLACNTNRPTKPSGTSGDLWAEFGPTFVQGWVALCTPKK